MTKKLCLIGAVVLIAAAALALENIALPTGGGFYEGTLYQPRTIVDSNTAAVTPRFIGELLLGKETGSNALWVARDLTTNGWGLITAEGGPFGNANITDLAATKLTGNIPIALMTNGAGTLGASIGGNIPVASITNAAVTLGDNLGGNIPVAAITNALTTSGPSVKGNIPVASITNAAVTLGSTLGGNIPVACITNALITGLSGKATAKVVTNASTFMTNVTFYGVGGVLISNLVYFGDYTGP